MTIGERISELRIDHNLSQVQLANIIGASQSTISDWELDKTSQRGIGSNDIIAMAKYFNVSADWILGLSETKTNNKKIRTVCNTLGISEKAAENLSSDAIDIDGLLTDTETLKKVSALFKEYRECSMIANSEEKPLDLPELTRNGYFIESPGYHAMICAYLIGMCFQQHLLNKLDGKENKNGKP